MGYQLSNTSMEKEAFVNQYLFPTGSGLAEDRTGT